MPHTPVQEEARADPTPPAAGVKPTPAVRFAQMMWRLNFLVFFCCVVLQVGVLVPTLHQRPCWPPCLCPALRTSL